MEQDIKLDALDVQLDNNNNRGESIGQQQHHLSVLIKTSDKKRLVNYDRRCNLLELKSDGSILYAARDGSIRRLLRDGGTMIYQTQNQFLAFLDREKINVLFELDESRFASGGSAGFIKVWNLSNNNKYMVTMKSQEGVNALAYLWRYRPGRATLASGNTFGTLELWDAEDGIRLLRVGVGAGAGGIRFISEMSYGGVCCLVDLIVVVEIGLVASRTPSEVLAASYCGIQGVANDEFNNLLEVVSRVMICCEVNFVGEVDDFYAVALNRQLALKFRDQLLSARRTPNNMFVIVFKTKLEIRDRWDRTILSLPFSSCLKDAIGLRNGSLGVVTRKKKKSILSIYQMGKR